MSMEQSTSLKRRKTRKSKKSSRSQATKRFSPLARMVKAKLSQSPYSPPQTILMGRKLLYLQSQGMETYGGLPGQLVRYGPKCSKTASNTFLSRTRTLLGSLCGWVKRWIWSSKQSATCPPKSPSQPCPHIASVTWRKQWGQRPSKSDCHHLKSCTKA